MCKNRHVPKLHAAEMEAGNYSITNITVHGDRALAKAEDDEWYYYVYNGHGDVVGLVNSNGELVNAYEYDAWGNITSQTETVGNRLKYAGEIYDEETGLIYLRNRYYDPSTGRFTQEDPARDKLNWYAYCGNNPVNFVDPSGESAIATAAAAGVAIFGPAVIDAVATATIYGFTGRHIGAGLINGFAEGLTTSVSTYFGGIPGAIIGGTLGAALGSMSEDLLFNKNKNVEDIAKSAAESAAWGLFGGISNSYIEEAIKMANKAGSAAQTLMKYDERFGKAIKIFFEQLVNILSSQ